jgi:hypothetical protein
MNGAVEFHGNRKMIEKPKKGVQRKIDWRFDCNGL